FPQALAFLFVLFRAFLLFVFKNPDKMFPFLVVLAFCSDGLRSFSFSLYLSWYLIFLIGEYRMFGSSLFRFMLLRLLFRLLNSRVFRLDLMHRKCFTRRPCGIGKSRNTRTHYQSSHSGRSNRIENFSFG